MNSAIDKAFRSIDRKLFVLPQEVEYAHVDHALPIGFGQTISQPTTVKMMLSWLDVIPGQKVLDVGSGSGWTTALLSELVGPKGQVVAVERIAELVKFGRNNCLKSKISNAKFYKAGSKLGYPRLAPYDRILVSASANEIPDELIKQLTLRGKMVIPIGYSVMEITKAKKGIDIIEHPGFVFVPLIY